MASGLTPIAVAELKSRFEKNVRFDREQATWGWHESARFEYSGNLKNLLRLRTALAVYLVASFDVQHPRALLSQQNSCALFRQIDLVLSLLPPGTFRTFFVSAAGSDSPVLRQFRKGIELHTGLTEASEADLQIRLRRPPGDRRGWEVLIRLSPRPLATRPWRVCNLEGALNATIAHTMALMTGPHPDDVFLNLACGSGTLLIERAICGPAKRLIGCDNSPEALVCARANIAASKTEGKIELHDWDMRALPLPGASVNKLCADLPFGHLVGSHRENKMLYPQTLQEAARVAGDGAVFVVITHERRLLEEVLQRSYLWKLKQVLQVSLAGISPYIFVLNRVPRAEVRI